MQRLVLIVAAFPRLSETFIVSKFLGLLERGWDVHIVCSHSEDQEWQRFPVLAAHPQIKNRVVVAWPAQPRWLVVLLFPWVLVKTLGSNFRGACRYLAAGWRRLGLGVWKHFYLDAPIISLRPDIVHFEFGALAVGRLHLKELLGCRLAISFRGYDLNFVGLEDPAYYQEVWDQADAVHLLGQDLWRRAQRRGCPSTKLHRLIPPAIDADFFTPGERPALENIGAHDRPLRILGVGRLEWKKGYEFALQAVRMVIAAGIPCEYRIIGGGQYLGPLAFLRHLLGLAREVHFLGPLTREEIKRQLQWADVFLHASVSEGFGNAVLEAQAMQVPVVTSDADGLPENVAHEVSGFVVPRRNARALAEKLMFLARDPALRRQMGQAGRQRVLTHFQLSEQIRAFDDFYKQVLRIVDTINHVSEKARH